MYREFREFCLLCVCFKDQPASQASDSGGSSGAVIGGAVGGVVVIVVIFIVVLLVLIYMRHLHQKKSSPVMAGITNKISDGKCS